VAGAELVVLVAEVELAVSVAGAEKGYSDRLSAVP